MKRLMVERVVLVGALCFAALTGQATTCDGLANISSPLVSTEMLASAQVPFLKNQGQVAESEVQFYARTFAGTLFVSGSNELVYALPQGNRVGVGGVWAFSESFVGASDTRARGHEPSSIQVSHFKGPDPSAWRSRIETFNGVDLGELYTGIRVTLHATGNNVEKLFHISPGGDVDAIDIAIDGVEGVAIDADHRLVLATSLGDIVFTAPEAYQVIDGRRRSVQVAYALREGDRYGFSVGNYDRERELVIDPLLESTYLGGHNPQPLGNYDDDIVWGMATDGGDGFVARLSADLSLLDYGSYLGGSGDDRPLVVIPVAAGLVYAAGRTDSVDFPTTPGAFDTTYNGGTSDAFISLFDTESVDSALIFADDFESGNMHSWGGE